MVGSRHTRGGLTISMTLLLLLMMGGLLAFSAQEQLSELRIQANEFRQREALSQAEGNLAQAIALLMRYHQTAHKQMQWPDSVTVEGHALQLQGRQGYIWQLSSQGMGQEAHIVVRRQVLAVPLLLRRPSSGFLPPDLLQAGVRVDYLDYLFGMPTSAHAITELTSMATQHVVDCNALDNEVAGLLLVEGPCVLRRKIGSAAHPVLLVVTSGTLQFEADASFYGLLLLLGDKQGRSIQWRPGAKLYGALVSQGSQPEAFSDLDVEYRPEILTRLQNSPALWRCELVAGSWRDW